MTTIVEVKLSADQCSSLDAYRSVTGETRAGTLRRAGLQLAHREMRSPGPGQAPASDHGTSLATTSSNPTTTKSVTKKRKKAATSIPEGFGPDDTALALASQLGLDVARERAAFADWTEAGAYRYVCWQSAFRSHLRRAAKRNNGAAVVPEYTPRPDY